MEDLQHILILHEEVEQGLQVEVRLGIDRSGLIRACDLNQAKVRPISVLAHELGVHGDERLAGEAVDECLEVVGLGNQWMDTHGVKGALAAASRVDKKVRPSEARGALCSTIFR